MADEAPLSGGFPPFSEEDWRAVAAKAAGVETIEALAARSDDGLAIGPLYGQLADGWTGHGRPHGTAWTIVQRVDDHDLERALANIAEDRANGADGIDLVFVTSPLARGRGLAKPGSETAARLLEALAGDTAGAAGRCG